VTKFALLLIALSTVAVAAGEPDVEKNRISARMAAMEKRWRIEDRAREIRPQRRDSPLRYLNISDEEVREVQAAAAEVLPRAIVNISGVVTGCPCEDGSDCTDQVWIVAYRPEKSRGLMLSKVSNHWVIGAVQRWWLRYEEHLARRPSSSSESAYVREEDELINSFPSCAAPLTLPGDTPAPRTPDASR
jgi:hypothetical protein